MKFSLSSSIPLSSLVSIFMTVSLGSLSGNLLISVSFGAFFLEIFLLPLREILLSFHLFDFLWLFIWITQNSYLSLKKVASCRSGLCVLCARLFWQACGSWAVLMESMMSGCWPLELEQLQVGRPGAFSNALFMLLAPIIRAWKVLGSVSRKLSARAPGWGPHLPYGGGREWKEWSSLLSPTPRIPAAPEGSHGFPAFSFRSLSLVPKLFIQFSIILE